MDDEVKAAIERLRESARWRDVELLCHTIESQAATIDAMTYAAGPHYRLHDGKSLSEVYLPTLLELLLTQTQATINDLRLITALGVGGCHDVKTDSDAWVRIERIES